MAKLRSASAADRRPARGRRKRAAHEGIVPRSATSASRPSTGGDSPAVARALCFRPISSAASASAISTRAGHVDGAGVAVCRPPRAGSRERAASRAATMPGSDIDQEQPVPGVGLGDPAADQRADGRRQHGQHAGHGGGDALLAERKQQEDGGEHRRGSAPAGEALHDAPADQRRRSRRSPRSRSRPAVNRRDAPRRTASAWSAARVSRPVSGMAMTSAMR